MTAVLVGLLVVAVPVLVVWGVDPRAGGGGVEALRTAGALWLVAHGALLGVPGGAVGLTPLAATALLLWLVARTSTRRGAEHRLTTVRGAGWLALMTGCVYGALGLGVALLSRTPDLRPDLLSVVASCVAVGGAGALLGLLRLDRLWRAAWLVLPPSLRRLVRGTLMSSGVLAATGALLVGASLATHGAQAGDLARASDPGPVGGVALLLLGLSLVPNAIVWGVAWVTGPGFALGAGTAVGPFAHELGPVPAFPLLAALPGTGVPGWVGALVLLLPLFAGALAGRSMWRELPDAGGWRAGLAAALVGPATGAVWAGWAWLSGGPVGGARLSDVGPSAGEVGVSVAVLVGLGAVTSALLHVVATRRRAARALSTGTTRTTSPTGPSVAAQDGEPPVR